MEDYMEDKEPMEKQSFGKIIKDIPRRLVSGVWQILGSRKAYALALTTWLIYAEKIPENAVGYVWGFILLLYIGGIEALKWLKDLKK
jgi:hypothetical protein